MVVTRWGSSWVWYFTYQYPAPRARASSTPRQLRASTCQRFSLRPIWMGASRRESRSSSSFGSSPRCPDSSSDTVSPRQSPRGSSRDRSGKFKPRSHLLTAWADTWRAWESSFWVSPRSRRAWAISAPVFWASMASPPASSIAQRGCFGKQPVVETVEKVAMATFSRW